MTSVRVTRLIHRLHVAVAVAVGAGRVREYGCGFGRLLRRADRPHLLLPVRVQRRPVRDRTSRHATSAAAWPVVRQRSPLLSLLCVVQVKGLPIDEFSKKKMELTTKELLEEKAQAFAPVAPK